MTPVWFPDAQLRRHDGFRVASDAYQAAIACGCTDGVGAALWAIVVREAKAAEVYLAGDASR
jgi:hypothetical protein